MLEEKFLKYALKDNEHAISFVKTLDKLWASWADLPKRADDLVWAAVVDLPTSPFYNTFRKLLEPVLQQSIIRAQVFPEQARDALADIITYTAAIVGEKEWALQVGREIREAVGK